MASSQKKKRDIETSDKTVDDLEGLESEVAEEDIDEDEEADFSVQMDAVEEERDEPDDAEENEIITRIDKKTLHDKSVEEDLFNDFEFVHKETESSGDLAEEVSVDIGGWSDGDKVCTAAINTSHKFTCIDYPGVIKNVDKVIETLGGVQDICTAIKENHRLELSFRPRDPYSKCTLSTMNHTRNLLVTIRRRRKLVGANSPIGESYEYQIEVQGIVERVHTFDKMVDFQYLPVIKLPSGQYKEILSAIQPKIDDERDEYLSRKTPLFLPPYSFSRREAPINFYFETEAYQTGDTVLGHERKKRLAGVIHLIYSDHSVPNSPHQDAINNLAKLPQHNLTDSKLAMEKLFEERPVWNKAGILAHIDRQYHRYIRLLLPAFAYYFETGPWRNSWCKFGYDPRKDPASKKYQALDFRLRTAAKRNQVEAKRGIEVSRMSVLAQKNTHQKLAPIHHLDLESRGSEEKLSPKGLDLTYIYSPNHLPPYRQMRYQVCDVMHDEVQRMMHENDGKETVCTERDGWCIPDFTDMCRDIMSAAIEKLFDF
ncbi:unnamed protein product [Lymnaea stagnalis]|uniref:General transcription factor 3C polypeptide 5 n=1 Tax=Lymnaea stagnalis TaxID=6523 RepID=A0AAV2HSC1_LYMST